MADAPLEFTTDLDLSFAGQDKYGLPRLYPGDTVRWRFQVRDDDDQPIDLTGYHIVLTARRRLQDTASVLRRRSTDPIVGASPATDQIVIDADQTAESEDGLTGRGWFQIQFLPLVDEETALLAAVGQTFYDIVLEAPDGTTTTFAEGTLEVPRRASRHTDVP
jgi:hypothetical protein